VPQASEPFIIRRVAGIPGCFVFGFQIVAFMISDLCILLPSHTAIGPILKSEITNLYYFSISYIFSSTGYNFGMDFARLRKLTTTITLSK
jgi:hypothetical protein